MELSIAAGSGALQIPETVDGHSWQLLHSGQPVVTCQTSPSGTGCCCSDIHLKALLCAQLGVLVAALLCALLPVLCTVPPASLCAAAMLQ